ncbi:hypothetical protein [Hwangdonia sp.]|uniref:hypothetical protein n=1 Tax=Hwangdonia sp. TaxID=1883432 RepID=UPI003AB38818
MWYAGRVLAESTKFLTWNFTTGTKPFLPLSYIQCSFKQPKKIGHYLGIKVFKTQLYLGVANQFKNVRFKG